MLHMLLLILVILSESIFQTWGEITVQPYGPKLCEVLCKGTKACSDHIFREVQLTCQLVINGRTSRYTSSGKDPDVTGVTITPFFLFSNTTPFRQRNEKISSENDDEHFFEVCKKGDFVKVKILLKRVGNINSKDSYDRTCVMLAAMGEQKDTFDYLVQAGCDLSGVDEDGSTVLHYACMGGSVYIVKKLVDDCKCDPHTKDEDWYTPLLSATKYIPIMKFLIDRGANLKVTDEENNTILHIVCRERHVDIVRFVLSLEVIDLESRDVDGKTPVMIAVKAGRIPIVDLLYRVYNASLTSADDFGYNVVHIACHWNRLSMVKYLLTLKKLKGFEGKRDNDGNTPVEVARNQGNDGIVSYLESK